MKIHVKNMVCDRCIFVIENTLKELNLQSKNVRLGVIDFGDYYGDKLDPAIAKNLKIKFTSLGFEFLDNKKSQIIEKIKIVCITLISSSNGDKNYKLSEQLSKDLNREYKYLSNLFSSVEGITIEQYFILQRIEKVKELMIYDELSLNEIAYKLSFSSAAHLSGQFKKVTGLTISHFKSNNSKMCQNSLDNL